MTTIANQEDPSTCILLYHEKKPAWYNIFIPPTIGWADVKQVLIKKDDLLTRDWERLNGDLILDGKIVILRDVLGVTKYSESQAKELNRMKQRMNRLEQEKSLIEDQKASSEVLMQNRGRYDFHRSEIREEIEELNNLQKKLFSGGSNEQYADKNKSRNY